MVAFGEAQTCRRQILLAYFGDKQAEPCANCDICLNPPRQIEVTEEARKALSCVYRVGQRFGIGHVIDVLRGSKGKRLLQLGHNRLSTYGIGEDRGRDFWSAVLRHLINQGYLLQDIANYSVLSLTKDAGPLLRGEISLTMPEPRVRATARKEKPKALGTLEYDVELFEQLRKLRKQIADEDNVPHFVVFSDGSLAEMAAVRPQNDTEMLAVTGVGKYKLERYGTRFLTVLGQ
jgi:ATP-dependent DNA helicase RecQ